MSLDCHVRSTMQVGNPVGRALFLELHALDLKQHMCGQTILAVYM